MNTTYQKIKTFKSACKSKGLDADKLLATWKKNGDTIDEIAYKMLKIFISAINGDWVPDFGNEDQNKWYVWYWVERKKGKGAGFRVSYTDTNWTYTYTNVGSRLCYETQEQARHGAKYAEKMYLDYFLG